MARQFEVVNSEPPDQDEPDNRVAQAATAAATHALLLGLKALSQRTLTALADLFTLITVALVFWLWAATPHPDQYQIVSLSIFALFVLAANWIVRRR